MTRRINRLVTILLITALSFSLTACNEYSNPQTMDCVYFDTFINFTTYTPNDVPVMYEASDMCEQYEFVFSPTDSNSELYKINHRLLDNKSNVPGEYTCDISEDMYNVLSAGIEYCKSTDNAFNPALGSLTSLWDFHNGLDIIPTDSFVKEAMAHTNIDSIELSSSPMQLTIKDDQLMLDLGAIVKGYAADNIARMMRDKDCTDAIISLGGNIYCIGAKNNEGYNVGIQKPFAPTGEYIKTLSVGNNSVVTSGIYERYFEKNGKIYHHIIDPSTGYPVDNDLASVTVIGKNSLECDILSTALLVMGKEKGLEYAKSHDINVIFIDKSNNIIND